MWTAYKWPLLAVTIALVSAYITMGEMAHDTSGPRTFIAALAAMCLGAWLYSLGRDGRPRDIGPDKENDKEDKCPTKRER